MGAEDRRPPTVPARPWLLPAATYAGLGFLAVWLPWRLVGRGHNPIDGMQTISFVLLFAVGAVVGSVWPAARLRLALFTFAVFVADIPIGWMSDPSSHNLLPFELAFYAVLSGLAALGALLARSVRRRLEPT
jgi:hypothetical protein